MSVATGSRAGLWAQADARRRARRIARLERRLGHALDERYRIDARIAELVDEIATLAGEGEAR